MSGIRVDIVVIGRNEGELIRKAVTSCRRAAEEFAALGNPLPKVIYVDSQSTDGSLELAQSLGAECHVVEGRPNPAAGRHLGFQHCSGEYVFFLDGDMEAYPGWLTAGVDYLEKHPHIAGAAGICDWEVYEGDRVTRIPNHSGIRRHGQKVTTDVGGGFIYRRDVLLEVGDFDPTMTRGGEFELYLRILAGGYHTVYLMVPMAVHRDMKGSMGRSFLRQSILSSNIFIPGVVARKAPRTRGTAAMLLKRHWLYLWHPLSLVALAVSFWAALSGRGQGWWVAAAVIAVQLPVAHWLYKNRSPVRALASLVTANFYAPAFVFGFVTRWPRVGGYYRRKGKV